MPFTYAVLVHYLFFMFIIGAREFPFSISIPLYLIFILNLFKHKKDRQSIFFRICLFFLVNYVIIESLLFLIKPEIIWNGYTPPDKSTSYYHIREPNTNFKLKTSEYSHNRITNTLGYTDGEWSLEKDTNTIRIICLGDSYTEGMGAVMDSVYSSFIFRSLSKRYKVEILNAGRSGSDPFFDYVLLRDKIIEYEPDIILQSFTSNDLYYDIITRGGMERFQSDKTLKFKNNYWWSPIYQISFSARILIQVFGNYDKYLVKTNKTQDLKKEAEVNTVQLFEEYMKLARAHNFKLIVFTFPFISDLTVSNENLLFYDKMNHEFSKFSLNFYNLQPCYEEYITEHSGTYKDYYWGKDGHHNAKGYEMMANCIEEILLPVLNSQ